MVGPSLLLQRIDQKLRASMAQALFARGLQTAALMAAVLSFAQAAEPQFNNPLVRQRADPQVTLQSDGYYYYTATVPEYDRIELRRARSLNALGDAKAQVVWRKHASGEMGAHIWAPEMHRIDGKWYIYFTAGRADAIWEIRLYVLENSSENPLEGEWIERGQLKTGWESFSLDATTFALDGSATWSGPSVRPRRPRTRPTSIWRRWTPLCRSRARRSCCHGPNTRGKRSSMK
jgi:hypothetical protein